MTAQVTMIMARAALVAPVVLVADTTARMAMTMTPKKVIQADKVVKVAADKVDKAIKLDRPAADKAGVPRVPAVVGQIGHKKVFLRLSLAD